MAFKHLLVLKAKQSGVANLDGVAEALSSRLAMHRTLLKTFRDSDGTDHRRNAIDHHKLSRLAREAAGPLLIISLLKHRQRTPEAGVPLDWNRNRAIRRIYSQHLDPTCQAWHSAQAIGKQERGIAPFSLTLTQWTDARSPQGTAWVYPCCLYRPTTTRALPPSLFA